MEKTGIDQDVIYQIEIEGNLSEEWLVYFEGLSVAFEDEITTVTGVFADQASLRGFLNWLWDLNFTILSARRLDTPRQGRENLT